MGGSLLSVMEIIYHFGVKKLFEEPETQSDEEVETNVEELKTFA